MLDDKQIDKKYKKGLQNGESVCIIWGGENIKMEWIKTSEKLPEQYQQVIYYFRHTGVSCGKYERTSDGDIFHSLNGFLCDDVTHWMPLPEPPENK